MKKRPDDSIIFISMVLMLSLGGPLAIAASDNGKFENFSIVTEEDIGKNSYIAYINGDISLIQLGSEIDPELYNYINLVNQDPRIKIYEGHHKHYLDLISKVQYTDSQKCYINEIVDETITKKDDGGYVYKDVIILDDLSKYLSEYDRVLIENHKFTDEDFESLLQKIKENDEIVKKVNEIENSNVYKLELKSED